MLGGLNIEICSMRHVGQSSMNREVPKLPEVPEVGT